MTHFSSYLFVRFIRAFREWDGLQADDVPSGETKKIAITKYLPYDAMNGVAAGIVKFNGLEYLVQVKPIFSTVKVEKPLTVSGLLEKGGM